MIGARLDGNGVYIAVCSQYAVPIYGSQHSEGAIGYFYVSSRRTRGPVY